MFNHVVSHWFLSWDHGTSRGVSALSLPLEERGDEVGHVVGGFALLFYACYGRSSVGSWLREII